MSRTGSAAGVDRREHEDASRHERRLDVVEDFVVLDHDEVAVGLVRQRLRHPVVVDPEERRSQITLAHPQVDDAAAETSWRTETPQSTSGKLSEKE